MDIEVNEVEGGLTQVVLTGRLDTAGVGRIEARFLEAVVAAGKPAIVDLSRVPYIASMGLRMLISAARSLARENVKLALYAPQDLVRDVLESVALTAIVPVCGDAQGAIAAVRAP